MEGNVASAFPVHLGTGKPFVLLGLILCPRSLPPAMQSPSPSPILPPRAQSLHSETPYNCAGPKQHPQIFTEGLTSKLQNSTLWRPSFGGAASPLPCTSPKHRPCLKLEHHPA